MADSTHPFAAPRRLRRSTAALSAAAVVALACGWSAAAARADGDPASDVLASQSLFMPSDGGVTPARQAQLAALLSAAQRGGYPLKVALIATPTDLGSVGQLWRQPESYARFLGEELSLVYHGTLLVVMPDGFGVYRAGGPVTAQVATLSGARRASLGAAALAAVQQLATASGHRLAVASVAALPRPKPGPGDLGAWAAFAVGLALIVLAWAASLRSRPLRRRSPPLWSGSPPLGPGSPPLGPGSPGLGEHP